MNRAAEDIQKVLRLPFKANEIRWKPKSPSNGKALAMPYVDPRHVMDRLDEAVGSDCWQDTYTILPNGGVICRLSLKILGEWIYKEGAGAAPKMADAGDAIKAGFSYAFRNAAVRWGIARYLYDCPRQWVEWDEQRKAFRKPPQLPIGFLPNEPRQPPPPKPEAARTAPAEQRPTPEAVTTATTPPAVTQPATVPAKITPPPTPTSLPKNGAELLARLKTKIERLTAEGYPQISNLIAHLQEKGQRFGALETWNKEAIDWAAKETGWFEAHMREEETKELLSGDMEDSLKALFGSTGRNLHATTKALFKKALKWEDLRVSHWRELCKELEAAHSKAA